MMCARKLGVERGVQCNSTAKRFTNEAIGRVVDVSVRHDTNRLKGGYSDLGR